MNKQITDNTHIRRYLLAGERNEWVGELIPRFHRNSYLPHPPHSVPLWRFGK